MADHSPSATSLRAFVRRFLIALVILTVVTAAGIGTAFWVANEKVERIATARIAPGVLKKIDRGKPANFLIIGSDTREGIDCGDPEASQRFGSADEITGRRSDTLMVAHVDPDTKLGLLVSFPRDLLVDVPGLGSSKINAAFNAGPQRVVETLQQNFDIPIHHYLEVDFCGFQGIVDAIGSVPIFFPTPARDSKTGLEILLPGCYPLRGGAALAYVRSRYYEYYDAIDGRWKSDPTSDLGRIRRQQYFIRSLAQVAIETSARHPLRANGIANEVVQHLTRDRDLGLRDLLALADTFRSVDPAAVEMVTVPWTVGPSGSLELDDEAAAPLFERLRSFGAAPEPPPDLPPSGVSVRVANGSGVAGRARETYDALGGVGFVMIDQPADADRSDYATTEVRYAAGRRDQARVVQVRLGGVGRLVEADTAGADVEVVLGRDFAGIVAPGTTLPASPTTSIPANPGKTPGITTPDEVNGGLPAAGC